MSDWREPTPYETAVLALLVAAPFPGRDELESGGRHGELEAALGVDRPHLQTRELTRANVHHRVPVDAHATDRDGMGVHALLHVRPGA